MRKCGTRLAAGVLAAVVAVGGWSRPTFAAAEGARGMVATVQPLATDAAVEVLKSGGNAIDAAVAAGLTLGVVDGHNSGIGGGCFMLIRLADGSFVALDGREVAPASATPDMFIREGKGDTELSQTGALASGVPGALAVYEYASKKFGKKSLKDVITPAAELAETGFKVDAVYARRLAASARELARFEGSRAVLLKEGGVPRAAGDVLVQKDLAKTYRGVAAEGADYFYRGPVAKAVGEWMSANGGRLTAGDFANYKIRFREPLVTTYRGYTVVGFPPPSSGGVHVAQVLNMLEHFDVKKLHEQDPALRVHVVAEAMKRAFADRAHFLGDPGFVPVPKGLIDREYAKQLAATISLERATKVEHGTPPNPKDVFDAKALDKHTTHIAVADGEGNWVAMTQTVNTGFGSKVIVPGTGVILNNEMDDFSIQPGVANHFGLVGSDANAVAPGKRPLSSMSPTIVLRDGKPVMTMGAAGGPRIISQVILAVSNSIDLGDEPEAALKRGRFHHQWSPDELLIERGLAKELGERLRAMGHTLNETDSIAAGQMIRLMDGRLVGQNEPRVPGKAAGH